MYSIGKSVAVIGLAALLSAGCSQGSSSNNDSAGGETGMTSGSKAEMGGHGGKTHTAAGQMKNKMPSKTVSDGDTGKAKSAKAGNDGNLDKAAVDTATVTTAKKSPYGVYLVDAAGMSLYLFKADTQGKGSTCYNACAEVWPPLLTKGSPEIGGKAKADLLGTIERKNGATQVTYNGWPLYYFAKDDEPGDTQGQDVHGFGGEWYLVAPDGTVVHAEHK